MTNLEGEKLRYECCRTLIHLKEMDRLAEKRLDFITDKIFSNQKKVTWCNTFIRKLIKKIGRK